MWHKIPSKVAAAAKKGLKLRKKKKTGNANNREGYLIAQTLVKNDCITTTTLKKIFFYHQRWKDAEQSEIVKINSLLWGGSAAHSWSMKELEND